jgi:hypothetical protein
MFIARPITLMISSVGAECSDRLNIFRSSGALRSDKCADYKYFVPTGLNRLHFDYLRSGFHHRCAARPDRLRPDYLDPDRRPDYPGRPGP